MAAYRNMIREDRGGYYPAAVAAPAPSTATSFTAAPSSAPTSAAAYLALQPNIDDWEAYSKWARGAPTAGWTRDDYSFWNTQGPNQARSWMDLVSDLDYGFAPPAALKNLQAFDTSNPEVAPVPLPYLSGLSRLTQPGMFDTSNPEVAPVPLPVPSSQEDQLLYGGLTYAKDATDQLLSQLSQAAGLPADFDWNKYLRQGARQHFEQYNTLPSYRYSNPIGIPYAALGNAAADYSELAPFLPVVGPGSDLWAAGNKEMGNRLAASQASNRADVAGLFSVLAGPLAAWAGPAITGAISSAGSTALAGAEELAALTGAVPAASTAAAALPGMLPTAIGAGVTSGITTAAQGGDPLQGFVRGALTSGASNYAAPALRGMFDSVPNTASSITDTGLLDQLAGMQPSYSTMANTTYDPMTDAPLYSTPAMTTFTGDGMLSAEMPTLDIPYDIGAQLAAGMSPMQISALDEENRTALEAGDTPAETAPTAPQNTPTTADQVVKYAKLGANLAKMFGGEGTPEDAPQRTEGQSDAEYAQSLANYIQVDAQALAEMGLVPGTPEYYDYLMSQIDASISDITGNLDFGAEDLSTQLRAKTAGELQALRRALYVRGQLDLLMGSGTYTDPFTGLGEEVITGGRQVQPDVAAYHRGLARTAGDLAGLTGREKADRVREFLGRDVDLYGAQAEHDARAEQEALLAQMAEDLKRRRSGMLGGFW